MDKKKKKDGQYRLNLGLHIMAISVCLRSGLEKHVGV